MFDEQSAALNGSSSKVNYFEELLYSNNRFLSPDTSLSDRIDRKIIRCPYRGTIEFEVKGNR